MALADGLFIDESKTDSISFSIKVAGVQSQSSNNFSVRLAKILAFDYDSLGLELGNINVNSLPVLNVVDERGRNILTLTREDDDNVSDDFQRYDPEGSKAQQFLNYPNPFGSGLKDKTEFRFQAKNTGKATIQVYTLAGNLVWKDNKQVGTTLSTFIWDGRNMNGQKVRNGVYIAVLKAPGIKATTKVLVVR